MALWTPYADEALDLTKPVKKEISTNYDPYQDYHTYQYPAYVGQISPISGVSACSYETYYQTYRPATLSPPASPNESGFSSPTSQFNTASPVIERRSSYVDVTSPYDQTQDGRCFNMPANDGSSSATYRKRPFDSIDVDSLSDDPDFQEFERDALRAMAEKNGGTLLGNNPRMRRAVRSKNETSDDSYRKQRERNNFAAKQSRDRRKLREIHLALKVSYLRREVAGLKALLAGKVCNRCQQSCIC